MQFVTAKLKRFDFHKKVKSDVHERTLSGAFITVISGIIVIYLLFTNIMEYLNPTEINHMVPDTTIGHEDVTLKFSVSFRHVNCDDISFKQEVTRSTIHTHSPEIFRKKQSGHNNAGCDVYGELVTDKAGGNFMLIVKPLPRDHTEEEHDHNNMMRQFPGFIRPNHAKPPDLSHMLETLEFDPIPTRSRTHYLYVHEPLKFGVDNNPAPGTGIYHYGIQVVPTEHIFLNRSISHSNQYSYTERSVEAQNVAFGVTLNGQQFKDQYGNLPCIHPCMHPFIHPYD